MAEAPENWRYSSDALKVMSTCDNDSVSSGWSTKKKVDEDDGKLVPPLRRRIQASGDPSCVHLRMEGDQSTLIQVILKTIEDAIERHLKLKQGVATVDVNSMEVIPFRHHSVWNDAAANVAFADCNHRIPNVAPGIVGPLPGQRDEVKLPEDAPVVRKATADGVPVVLAVIRAEGGWHLSECSHVAEDTATPVLVNRHDDLAYILSGVFLLAHLHALIRIVADCIVRVVGNREVGFETPNVGETGNVHR
mmetsp:Transcript_18872/g.43998  ORF Transcript_18872/g.43998 Transcript_18872/m.43998 type:complete len:249 (-) Transcript_18872:302-1048(-)